MKEITTFLDALRGLSIPELAERLHRIQQAGAPPLEPLSTYERLRDHLERRDERLRHEAGITDQLLSQLQSPVERTPTVLQIQASALLEPGGTARVRFEVHNDLRRVAHVTFRPDSVRVSGEVQWLPVRFEPPELRLQPGERARVCLDIDTTTVARPGESCTTEVHVLRDGAAWAIVFVDLRVALT